MLEEILGRENMSRAFKQVKSNKGAPGVDGMSVDELQAWLNANWSFIKAEILEGKYKPSAVRKVEIPKANGGKRMLGIPTVLDRLMSMLSKRIADEGLLRLIRKYLRAGIMQDGIVESRSEGTPQGSPLSPILSNIVLDELDKELGKLGHCFVRYADDLSIYARSRKSAERVKESITKFIEKRMKLKVNREKSSISAPGKSSLLGFSFYKDKNGYQIRISDKSYLKFKSRIRSLTSRRWSISIDERLERLKQYTRG